MKRKVGAVTLLAVLAGCVTPYNHAPFAYDDKLVPNKLDDHFSGPVVDNWNRTTSVCYQTRAAMTREADEITRKNTLTGALFSMLVGGLSLSATLYTTLNDDPKKKVITVLSLGSAVSTVPTFFYFGTDERAKILRERAGKIDQGLANANEAHARLLTADRARIPPERPTLPAGAKAAEQHAYDEEMTRYLEEKKAYDAKKLALDGKYQEAKDGLELLLHNLADVCE